MFSQLQTKVRNQVTSKRIFIYRLFVSFLGHIENDYDVLTLFVFTVLYPLLSEPDLSINLG